MDENKKSRDTAEEMTGRLNESTQFRNDPFSRMSAEIEEATDEESAELLNVIGQLSEEDLEISSVHRFELQLLKS